jgi:hypothetical protein
MSKKETDIDNMPRHLKTKANKFERVRAENNLNTLKDFGILDLFEAYKQGLIYRGQEDAEVRHEEDWSGISLEWDFQKHEEDDKSYTIGKGIFATVKNEDVFISYSGLDSQKYLVSRINIDVIIYLGIVKARHHFFQNLSN